MPKPGRSARPVGGGPRARVDGSSDPPDELLSPLLGRPRPGGSRPPVAPPDDWLFLGRRSFGRFDRPASSGGRPSATTGLDETAPALAVACVLDGDPATHELVAESIGRGPILSGPGGQPLFEEASKLILELVLLVGQ